MFAPAGSTATDRITAALESISAALYGRKNRIGNRHLNG